MPFGGGKTTSLPISAITGLATATLTVQKVVAGEVDTDTLTEKTAGGAGIAVSVPISVTGAIDATGDVTGSDVLGYTTRRTVSNITGAADVTFDISGYLFGFTVAAQNNAVRIVSVTIYLKKVGSPNAANLNMYVGNTSGSNTSQYGTSSTTVTTASLTTSYVGYTFAFPVTTIVPSATAYCFYLGLDAAMADASNCPVIRQKAGTYTNRQWARWDAGTTTPDGAKGMDAIEIYALPLQVA